jgi:hypothetical protein
MPRIFLTGSTSGRGYYTGSGVISLPNRVRMREVDSLTGSYPTCARTTGLSGSLKGDGKIAFNDLRTPIFKSYPNAVFPLVTSQQQISIGDSKSLIASPNKIGDLTTSGTSSDIVTYQGFRTYFDNKMPLDPFNESKIYLGDKNSNFYASGTSGSIYPGFGSPLRDKFIIKVPINSSEEKIVTRYNSKRLRVTGLNIGLFDLEWRATGFCYYNHSLSRWEDIGLYSPTGSEVEYQMFYRSHTARAGRDTWVPSAQTHGDTPRYCENPKMQQFKMSDHMGVFVDSIADQNRTSTRDPYSILTASLAYDKIGCPTIAGQAPEGIIYAATGSHLLKMSDYITSPFILEKAVIEIPVIVQRSRGGVANPNIESRFFESCRDIDNYMFFIYRQRSSTGNVDSVEYIKNSKRMLVCSGAAAFYNSNAFSGRVPELIRSKGLPHTPSFSHDFQIASGTSPGGPLPPLTHAFTGTIRIEMIPSVGNQQFAGGSRFPLAGPNYLTPLNGGGSSVCEDGVRSIVTQDYWPGGTLTLSTSYSASSNGQPNGASNPYVFGTCPKDLQVGYGATLSSPAQYYDKFQRRFKVHNNIFSIDERPLRAQLGMHTTSSMLDFISGTAKFKTSTGFLGYTNKSDPAGGDRGHQIGFGGLPSATQSPYVLLPGDTLVLGLDAGVSMLPSSGSSMVNCIADGVDVGVDLGFYKAANDIATEVFGTMSGSLMKIRQEDASLTLFGSLCRENRELMFETNQNLTSDAIHEAVGCNRVTDQFMIEPRMAHSASYIDRYIGGVFKNSEGLPSNGWGTVTAFQNTLATYDASADPSGMGQNFVRRTVGCFSKNWKGLSRSNPATLASYSPIGDSFTGTPVYWKLYASNAENDYISVDEYNVSRAPWLTDESSYIRSFQRFVSFKDSTERYYDSIMPDIVTLASRSESLSVETVSSGAFRIRASVTKPYNFSWPYFGNPKRYTSQNFYLRVTPTFKGSSGKEYYDFRSDYQTKLVNTTLFQVGWDYRSYDPTSVSTQYGFVHPSSGAHGPLYGIISPMPMNTKAVFRHDRYGQFRDLLEQRKYSRFLKSSDGKPASVEDGPVSIKFVSSLDGSSEVSPFSTDSINCSTHATSSAPFSDEKSIRPQGDDSDTTVIFGSGRFYTAT